ncbi:MAG: transposase [Desulfobulbaceae bacterium]|nr:transposase [Desulfobulbaceae bacterium]
MFIRPDNPTNNLYIESFGWKFRDECLSESGSFEMEKARPGKRNLAE